MALSEALNAKLNEQITNEMYAGQTYQAMACMFRKLGLNRLPALFQKQVEEEREHAQKILDYIERVDGTVKLSGIPEPKQDWPSVVAAIEGALEHEKKVTAQIHAMVEIADKDKDYASRSFLNWFVDEQVEEEDSMRQLLDVARLAGDHFLQLEAYVGHLMAHN
jgi:ferritin